MDKTPERSLLSIEQVGLHLPETPTAALYFDTWGGIAVEHAASIAGYHVAIGGLDHHFIGFCPKGTGWLIQARLHRRHESAVSAGMAVIMPAGLDSTWEGDVPETLRLRLPTRLLDEVENELGSGRGFELLNRFSTRDPLIDAIASLLLLELRRGPGDRDRLLVESLATTVAGHLWRAHNARSNARYGGLDAVDAGALEQAVGYIRANLGQRFRLQDLSAVADVSRFQFSRMFKRAYGVGPAAYIRSVRIAEAKRLIEHSRFSLRQIAATVGFDDQRRFAAWFTQVTGMAPSRWAAIMGVDLTHRE